MTMELRKSLELKHNREVILGKETQVWGWGGIAGKRRLKRRINIINDYISSNTTDKHIKVLELGCGTGLLSEGLRYPEGGKLVSVDIYENFLHKAASRTIKNKPFFIASDVEMLPFGDCTFDFVVGISILHHLDLNLALKEIYRILKASGKFIFSEPNMRNPQIFLERNVKFIRRIMGASPYETAFYAADMKSICSMNKLRAEVRNFDFLHPLTPKALIPFVEKMGRFLERNAWLKRISGSLLISGEKEPIS